MALYQVHTSLKYNFVDGCRGGRRSSDTDLYINLRSFHELLLFFKNQFVEIGNLIQRQVVPDQINQIDK